MMHAATCCGSVQARVHKEEYLSANKMFLKYKGHQTYFCVAIMITPCQIVVNACALCTSKRAFVGRYTGVRHSLLLSYPLLVKVCASDLLYLKLAGRTQV